MKTVFAQNQSLFTAVLALTFSVARIHAADESANTTNAPYYKTYYGFSGAHAAAAQNSVEHLKELLDDDPTLISSRNGPNRTPLCIAAMRGNKEAVEYLLSRGADVNDRGFEELTPLADMAMYGTTNDDRCAEIAEMLVAAGAQVDPVDAFEATPLLHAVEMNKKKLAHCLLMHGADPSRPFSGVNNRITPLQYALKHSNLELARIILEFKPPLEWVDTDGATPLMWAVKSGKLEAARLLLEHGANPNPAPVTMESQQLSPSLYHFITNNSHGFTPLHWAVMRTNTEMIALLLEFKAPLDVHDEMGATPLHWAVGHGNKEIVSMLLQAGAPLSAAGRGGETPLHQAVRRNDKEIVAILLKARASVEAQNNGNQTPLDVAKQMDNLEIQTMLRDAAPARVAGKPAPVLETTGNIVSRQTMIDLAKRIADGDPGAYGELMSLAEELYRGVNHRSNPSQYALVSDRMNTTVKLLGEEAGKGNENALQALKKLVKEPHFKDSVAAALGPAAAAGNKDAIDILTHPEDRGIIPASADFALQAAAEANVQSVVDYFAAVLAEPKNAFRGRYGAATSALKAAADKGNQTAKDALEKHDGTEAAARHHAAN